MNIEQARFNMVEQQIRPWEVLNTTVLDMLYVVRREDFVPPVYRALAFVDMEIPLDFGETMLSPKVEARLIQSLKPKGSDRTLLIGTGSGYMAALLGKLTAQVTTVEIHPGLASQAQEKLAAQGLLNVRVEVGDGARGWPSDKPWELILLTGSVPALPQRFLEMLAPGGCLVAVVGDAPAMQVKRWINDGRGITQAESLFETVVPPLHHNEHLSRFEF